MHVLMSCMKDEGPFVLEYVAHHLVLGFDRLLIASNDCRDGTEALLRCLHVAGYIQHIDQTIAPDEVPQHAGYAKLRAQYGLRDVEWLMMLDVDEFLHVRTGDGSVQALTARAPTGADVIALNALTFGTIPFELWEPGRVCPRFTRRLLARNRINGTVKSLTREPQRFKGIHNHHMVGYRGQTPLRVMRADGSVHELDMDLPLWKQLRVIPPKLICHDLAHYNHYAVKTLDSFSFRSDRGRGAAAAAKNAQPRHTEDYFVAHLTADIEDTSINIYADRVVAMMEQMLSDPAIAAAQADTEARYLALISPYRQEF